MALAHLAPAPGIRDKALYANLTAVPPTLKTAVARRAAARSEAQAEAHIKTKVEQANGVLDRLEERVQAVAVASKALDQKKRLLARRIERITDAILQEMQDAQLTKVDGIRCSFSARPAAAALEVVDQTKLPAEFLRQPKTPPAEPDKLAIKAALAANDELLPGDWGCKLTSKISLIRK